MKNDDLKKLQECNSEIFEGISLTLENLGLGHLQVVGLEIEPSSVKIGSIQPNFEKGTEVHTTDQLTCKEGYKLVLKVDPRTDRSYHVCVPIRTEG